MPRTRRRPRAPALGDRVSAPQWALLLPGALILARPGEKPPDSDLRRAGERKRERKKRGGEEKKKKEEELSRRISWFVRRVKL